MSGRGAMRGLAMALCLVGFAGTLRAQERTDQPALSVERLWSEPGPGGFFAATSAEVLRPGAWAFRMLASLMRKPIVLSDLRTGEEVSVPVDVRLGYELALAVGVTRTLQLGVALPLVSAQDGDRLQGIGLDEKALRPVTAGDLRLHAKLRLDEGRIPGLGYGLVMHLALPTGDEEHFAGERGAVVSWSLVAGYERRDFRAAANFGLRLRTEEVVLLSPARPHGNEILVTIGAEWLPRFDWGRWLSLLAEYTHVEGDGGGASPSELRTGARFRLSQSVDLTAAAGLGTSPDQVGSPTWRGMLVLDWNRFSQRDLDRDGVLDQHDGCPSSREDVDGFQDGDGCPEHDNDGDGMRDDADECPDEPEDFDGTRDVDGCPEREGLAPPP